MFLFDLAKLSCFSIFFGKKVSSESNTAIHLPFARLIAIFLDTAGPFFVRFLYNLILISFFLKFLIIL